MNKMKDLRPSSTLVCRENDAKRLDGRMKQRLKKIDILEKVRTNPRLHLKGQLFIPKT
jgi:hypothetical protein